MAFELDYKAVMRALERDLIYTLTIREEDLKSFKRNLSQAKVRMGIEGKLNFLATSTNLFITTGFDVAALEVQIVLVPKAKKTIQVFQVNPSKGSFEL